MSKPQIRIFKMQSWRVYYTPSAYVPISCTSLARYGVTFSANTYWKVEVKKYDSATDEVEVKVLDFKSADVSTFKTQTTSVQLKGIKFEHLKETSPYQRTPQDPIYSPETPQEFVTREEVYQISYPVQKLDFQNGKISLQLDKEFIPELVSHSLQLVVPSPAAREQLNAIKPYIIKSLGSENVVVHVKLREERQNLYQATGHSGDLDKINERVIKQAKYEYVLQSIASSSIKTSRSFSPEEFGEEQLGIKLSPLKTLDFLRDLNKLKKALHFEHIEYLCTKQNEYFPIRFITDPTFAFLLVIERDKSIYAVLECYDKPLATYVWSYSKGAADIKEELNLAYRAVEGELTKTGKRSIYTKNKPENFMKIDHNYADPKGFELWRQEIANRLK